MQQLSSYSTKILKDFHRCCDITANDSLCEWRKQHWCQNSNSLNICAFSVLSKLIWNAWSGKGQIDLHRQQGFTIRSTFCWLFTAHYVLNLLFFGPDSLTTFNVSKCDTMRRILRLFGWRQNYSKRSSILFIVHCICLECCNICSI